MDKHYEFSSKVAAALRLNTERVFAIQWQGDRFWIKQPVTARKTIWHGLSAWVARLTDNPLFMPTVSKCALSALDYEIKHISRLHKKGASVPVIVAKDHGWFATADHGITLQKLFKRADLPDDNLDNIVVKAGITLAELHHLRDWHGRPALRDMLWDGEKVTLIDFEENPAQHLSTVQCMSRDIFLFMHGVLRFYPLESPVVTTLWSKYCQIAPKPVIAEAVALANNMTWLYWLSRLCVRFTGNDVRQTYTTLAFFGNNL